MFGEVPAATSSVRAGNVTSPEPSALSPEPSALSPQPCARRFPDHCPPENTMSLLETLFDVVCVDTRDSKMIFRCGEQRQIEK